MSQNRGGDVLARGNKSAQFRACEPGVTQKQWDAIFGTGTKIGKKRKKKSKR